MTDKGIFPLIFITGDKSQLNDADSSRPRWSHKLPMISTFAQQAPKWRNRVSDTKLPVAIHEELIRASSGIIN